jgi:hypothetical protein
MEIPANRLVELQVEEFVQSSQPNRHTYWRSSGSVVICTVTGAHRAVFVLEGLSAYEMRLALAPVLADLGARVEASQLLVERANREDAPTLFA